MHIIVMVDSAVYGIKVGNIYITGVIIIKAMMAGGNYII